MEESAWATHDVHQHGAFLDSSNASGDSDKHQTNRNHHHECRRREEMIVHEDAEVIENRIYSRPNGHQQQ
jgi:hypothetical protein